MPTRFTYSYVYRSHSRLTLAYLTLLPPRLYYYYTMWFVMFIRLIEIKIVFSLLIVVVYGVLCLLWRKKKCMAQNEMVESSTCTLRQLAHGHLNFVCNIGSFTVTL